MEKTEFEDMILNGNVAYGENGNEISSWAELKQFFESFPDVRVLLWESEAESVNDDGSKAFDSITSDEVA